jgi:hypothetical protein
MRIRISNLPASKYKFFGLNKILNYHITFRELIEVHLFQDFVRFHITKSFFIIPVYLQSVQVHSVNWFKEVDECLGEGRSLALFYS